MKSVCPFEASVYPKTVEIDSTQGGIGKRTAEYHDPHHVVFRLRTATQGFSCCLKTVTKLSLVERKQVTSLLRFTSALHGLKLLTTFKETKIGCAKRVNDRLAVLRSSLRLSSIRSKLGEVGFGGQVRFLCKRLVERNKELQVSGWKGQGTNCSGCKPSTDWNC